MLMVHCPLASYVADLAYCPEPSAGLLVTSCQLSEPSDCEKHYLHLQKISLSTETIFSLLL